MVRHRRIADAPRDDGANAVAFGEPFASEDELLVVDQPQNLDELRARAVVLLEPALVLYLPTTRGVERRLCELDLELAVAEVRVCGDRRAHVELLVADKLRRRSWKTDPCARGLTRAARNLAMLLHQPGVLLVVEGEAALTPELLGELDRKAVRRLQIEDVLGGDLAGGRSLLELRHPALERQAEALLLGREHAVDLPAMLDELRIRRLHLLDHDVGEAREERRLHADAQAVLNRAPDDAAQDVAAPEVGRRDALGGDEGHAAPVIGEDPMRLGRVLGRAVGDAGFPGDPVHDQPVAVGVVDGRNLLHDTCDALEPPAGVDVLARQLGERALGVDLVRHEDEIPELEEALAARAAGQAIVVAAAGLLAPVPVHLRVGAARPRAADRPEVLGGRQRHDALRRQADLLPVADRLLVGAEPEPRIAGVHADPDAVPVELEALLHELGRVRDRALLEVLPEREVAQHLEEGEVERVQPDLVDVLGAEDLLARRRQRSRRWFETEEVRHLRLHAGARVEGRVVVGARDQGRGRATKMGLLLEERLESLPQLGRRAHGGHSRSEVPYVRRQGRYSRSRA